MRFLVLIFVLLTFSCKHSDKESADTALKDGDLIFQTSLSNQSKAIQAATKSKWSHCGIIYKEGNSYYVFEAIQPVTNTPLKEWIARGEGSHYVVKRLKEADKLLTPETLQKMKAAGKSFAGKDYDLYFGWSDDRIYCSELIWKIYKRGAGIEIGIQQQLKDFNLTNQRVKQKLKERYGNNVPLYEKVISPAAMFESELLYTVASK